VATGRGASIIGTKTVEKEVASSSEIFVPLKKLKNARKMPHGEAAIEALAGSIRQGMLQNLVVEPDVDANGAATGFYLVTVGEGRRLAQPLRAKRKQITKSEPVRCILDTASDPRKSALMKTSPVLICIRRTNSRCSPVSPKRRVMARRKSRLASAWPLMLCDRGCGWVRSRQT
jgi:hypothetical protein